MDETTWRRTALFLSYSTQSNTSTPARRIGSSKKIVIDGCLPTHRLRSDFLGVPGGRGHFLLHPSSVPVSVPVCPLTRHNQCNVMQHLLSPLLH